MNKHSKPLLTSIIIHALVLASVLYAYNTVVASKGNKQEKRVCIRLGCITENMHSSKKSKKIVKKKIEKPKFQAKPKHHTELKKEKHIVKKPKVKKKIEKKTVKKVPQKRVEEIEKKEIAKNTEESLAPLHSSAECKQAVAENKKTDKTQVQEKSSKSQYVDKYLVEIARLLQENLYYPRRARKRGVQGRVLVKFTLQKDAQLRNIKVLSSQSDILSRGAIKTLQNLSGKFPKPDEVLTLTVPIIYSLH